MKFFGVIIFFLASINAHTQDANKLLIPFRKGNLWGYSDVNKKIIIPIKFEEAGTFGYSTNCCFYDFFAKVRYKGKDYLVEKNGKLTKESTVINQDEKSPSPPQRDEMLGDYVSKEGAIINNDEVIIPAKKYKSIRIIEGCNSYFAVKDSTNSEGLINREGELIIPIKYAYVSAFKFKENCKPTVTNDLKPSYFVLKEHDKRNYTLIKYIDKIVGEIEVVYFNPLNNSIAFCAPNTQDNKFRTIWGILDCNFKVIVKPKYAEIVQEEMNNIFLVKIYGNDKSSFEQSKSGYINKKGTEFF